MSAEIMFAEIAEAAGAAGELDGTGSLEQPEGGNESFEQPEGDDPGERQPVRQQATERPQLNPDSTDLSEITAAAPADINLNPALVNSMSALLQGLGLDEKQISTVVRGYIAAQTGELASFDERGSQARDIKMRDLRNEWGSGFDSHVADAQHALQSAAGPAAKEIGQIRLADGSFLGDDPRMIRLFAELGSRMQRPSAGDSTQKSGGFISSTSAQEQREELQGDPEFMRRWSTRDAPGHDAAVRKMNSLTAAIGR